MVFRADASDFEVVGSSFTLLVLGSVAAGWSGAQLLRAVLSGSSVVEIALSVAVLIAGVVLFVASNSFVRFRVVEGVLVRSTPLRAKRLPMEQFCGLELRTTAVPSVRLFRRCDDGSVEEFSRWRENVSAGFSVRSRFEAIHRNLVIFAGWMDEDPPVQVPDANELVDLAFLARPTPRRPWVWPPAWVTGAAQVEVGASANASSPHSVGS